MGRIKEFYIDVEGYLACGKDTQEISKLTGLSNTMVQIIVNEIQKHEGYNEPCYEQKQ